MFQDIRVSWRGRQKRRHETNLNGPVAIFSGTGLRGFTCFMTCLSSIALGSGVFTFLCWYTDLQLSCHCWLIQKSNALR